MKLPKGFMIVTRTEAALQCGTKQGLVSVYNKSIKVLDKSYSSIPHRDLIVQEICRVLNKEVNIGLRLVA